MATVDLTTKFLPKVDEQFTAESKRSLVTNQDFTWDGAATVRVYKVSTGKMNDYSYLLPPEEPTEDEAISERNHNLI